MSDLSISSRLKKVGIALGPDPYASASASFTQGLLVSQFSCNPKTDIKPIGEVRGDFATRRMTTNAGLDFDASLAFPLDMGDDTSGNIGHFLYALLGIDTVTTSGSLHLHTFTRKDISNPAYLNLYTDKDSTKKQYVGFRPNSLKLTMKAGDGSIECSVSGIVQSESALPATQTLVFSTSPLVTPQQANVVFNSLTPLWEEFTIEIKREVQRFRSIGNTRNILEAYTKNFSIEFSAKGLIPTNEVLRSRFLSGTDVDLSLVIGDISGTNPNLWFNLPQVMITKYDGPDVKDQDLLNVSIAGVAINTYTIELKNDRATSYGV